jgi:diguanylate cyclase (GGDEF)-like protein
MAAGKQTTPLCEQFGFDAKWREAQLKLLGLDDSMYEEVRLLQDKVLTAEVASRIFDHFYEQLGRNDQAASILSSFDLGHLKERQIEYIKAFGVGFKEASYFESRARVGVAHARVGVPMSLYLESFGMLQCLILAELSRVVEEKEHWQKLVCVVVKLTTLDIALATEVYHRSQIQDLDRSLKHLESERKSLRKQLEQDELTGVSSRTSLLRELTGSIERSSKTGQPLVVIMADLDNFKVINDSHGHLVGDRVLKEVAARIKAALREFDVVGRYGGEEFVILLENTSTHTAHQIAERIRVRVGSQPIHTSARDMQVTISQGLALCGQGDDSQSVLSRADQAMYRAKEAGRNCIVEQD